MNRLSGKVALVTGAARGLGAAQVQALVKEGARVVFGDVADEEGQTLEQTIRAGAGDARYRRFDVTSETDWINVVAATVAQYGRLNVLVNNACLLYTSPSPRDPKTSRMPSSA